MARFRPTMSQMTIKPQMLPLLHLPFPIRRILAQDNQARLQRALTIAAMTLIVARASMGHVAVVDHYRHRNILHVYEIEPVRLTSAFSCWRLALREDVLAFVFVGGLFFYVRRRLFDEGCEKRLSVLGELDCAREYIDKLV